MFRYRIMIILVIGWMALALNLERPDQLLFFGNINISSYVYMLGALVMILMLAFLRLVDIPLQILYIPIFLSYVVGKALIYDSSVDPARFAYLSVLEAIGLFVTTWIIKHLAQSIKQFDTSIEDALIQKNQHQVLSALDGENAIQRKIERARRFNRRLALLYIALGEQGSRTRRYWDQEAKVRHSYLQVQLSELMNYLIDETDIRVWHADDMILCLLETSKDEVVHTAHQIQQVLQDVLGIESHVGIGSFPDDGLIYRDLLNVARQNALPEPA